MLGLEYEGQIYNDDRIFVLHIAKCTVAPIDDETIETTIYHDQPPAEHIWCLVTYRNVARYPAVRVDHFESNEAARVYMERVEPTVPRISLGGQSPVRPMRIISGLSGNRAITSRSTIISTSICSEALITGRLCCSSVTESTRQGSTETPTGRAGSCSLGAVRSAGMTSR